MPRINPRIMSWRFYFLNKGRVFISYSSASPSTPSGPAILRPDIGAARKIRALASSSPRLSLRAIRNQLNCCFQPAHHLCFYRCVGSSLLAVFFFFFFFFLSTGYSDAECFVSVILCSKNGDTVKCFSRR